MDRKPGTIERAYELAREGHAIEEIRRMLRTEGYADAARQLFGQSLSADLRRLKIQALADRK
jgi:predicted RNA binding protein with dsRBD fold (UPF0201 family)